MKTTLLIIGTLIMISGCSNKNYYEVMNVNQQRYGGTQLENAQFLNESYDLVLLIGNLSAEAEKRSTLKESFLLAKEASKDAKSLHLNFKVEAARHRAKLTTDLSKSSDEYLHQLDDISTENFDRMYLQYTKVKLEALNLKMESYTASGESERLVELADEVQDCFRSLSEHLNQEK